jgi:hypothetical protein
MKKITALFGLVVVLTACSTDEPIAPAPVNHGLPPKITLDVQTITLADRTGMQPSNSPYNSDHFSPTISEAIKQWATDRLQAAGQTGQAIVIVKDASLTSQALPTKSGMDSWFTRQQATKYIGHAEVSVEANGREGFATTDASATRAVTLPENPTPSERQDAYYTLLNGLMKDLGQNLESGLKTHVAPFMITAPLYGAPTSAPMNAGITSATMTDGLAAPVMEQPLTAPTVNANTMARPDQYMTPSAMPQASLPPVTIPLSGSYAQ